MSEQVIDWAEVLPGLGGTEVSRLCIGLLKKRLNNQISEDEFEKELNYVSLMTLDDFRWAKLPEKPVILIEFEEDKKKSAWTSKPFKDRAEIEAKVSSDPEIQEYWKSSQSLVHRNRSNAMRLEEMADFFSKLGDFVSAQKCRIVYNEFPPSIYHGDRAVWLKRKI